MKKFKNILIGFFSLLSIAILIWGINYLNGNNFFVKENKYYAIYDRIDGLVESSPVMVKGLSVGKVNNISFIEDTTTKDIKVLVSFVVAEEILIPDSSIAEIMSIDLMGSKAINLQFSSSEKNHQIGDTLISSIEQGLKDQVSQQMLPLKVKTEDLLSSIDSVMTVIQYIFNDATRDNLSKTFASIKKTIQNLESASVSLDTLMRNEKGKLSRIFTNLESITTNLNNNSVKLNNIISNFSIISDSLAKAEIAGTINKANLALTQTNEIIEKINRGEGSLGALINNDSLYNNLEKAAFDLDMLLKDIEQNPKKYLHFSIFDFGKTYILDENGDKVKPKKGGKGNKDETSSIIKDDKIYFRVQIKSSIKRIDLSSRELKGIENVNELYTGSRYKYSVGNETDFDKARILQNEIREIFPDAFVIAVKNGETIPVHEALSQL